MTPHEPQSNPQSEIRNRQLACPGAERLDAFVKGQLCEAETEVVAAHLDACDDCWRRVQSNPTEAAMDDDLRWASRLQAETQVDINVPLARLSEHLPDYEIVGEIGRGGMGIVYKAYHPRLDRMVALKVLPALLGAVRPDAISRFRREAALAARLKHNNIIAVYDCGEIDGTLYYTMELVEGPSLRDVLQEIKETGAIDVVVGEPTTETSKSRNVKTSKEGEAVSSQPTAISQKHGDPSVPSSQSAIRHPKPKMAMTQVGSSTVADRSYYRRVATWMAEVAEALDYAHGRGVIHRDVKPSNLLLSADGRIMISDFGLARGSGVETLTATRSLMGTCRYMSPEQVDESRGPIDARTDVYALGATMYELLAFRPMFAGAGDREVLGCVLNKEPTPPCKSVRQVPRDLGTICLKAVEKDRDARYATAQTMADDLRRWLLDLPIHARRPSLPARAAKFARRRKLPVAAVALSVALLVATAGLAARHVGLKRDAERLGAAARSTQHQLVILQARGDLENGRLSAGLAKVDAALGRAPNSPDLRKLRAEILLRMNRNDEAIEILERVLSGKPDYWPAHYILAQIHSPRKSPPAYRQPATDEQKAAFHREQVERLMPDSAEAYYIQARHEPDPRRAVALLNQALDLDPLVFEYVYDRSQRYGQLEEFEAMLLDAERCVAMRKDWMICYVQRGLAFQYLGRFDEALRDFDRAVKLDRRWPVGWYNRGIVKSDMGDFRAAFTDFTEAIRLDSEYANAYAARGRARAKMGDLDAGLSDLDRAIRIDAAHVDAYLERSFWYGQMGRFEDAIADSSRVIQLKPDNLNGYRNRATVYRETGQHERVVADCTAYIKLKPDDGKACRTRGDAHAAMGQFAEAVADYTRAIELDPDHARVNRGVRASVYIQCGRFQDAIEDLTHLIGSGPANAVLLLRRGMVYELGGQAELALEDYRRAMSNGGPVGEYARLWGCLLLRSTGRNKTLAGGGVRCDPAGDDNLWVWQLFSFFAVELSRDELLAAAVTDDERAEAYYYIGRKAVLDGRPDEAADAFAKCVALDRNDVLETDFARALLRRLEQLSGSPQDVAASSRAP